MVNKISKRIAFVESESTLLFSKWLSENAKSPAEINRESNILKTRTNAPAGLWEYINPNSKPEYKTLPELFDLFVKQHYPQLPE